MVWVGVLMLLGFGVSCWLSVVFWIWSLGLSGLGWV